MEAMTWPATSDALGAAGWVQVGLVTCALCAAPLVVCTSESGSHMLERVDPDPEVALYRPHSCVGLRRLQRRAPPK